MDPKTTYFPSVYTPRLVLILSLMLILFAAMPYISKRQDVRQTTVDANRYATWQMTVSTSVDRELVIDRFFSDPNSPIRSIQTNVNENSFWNNQNTPLIRERAFVAANAQNTGFMGSNNHPSLVDPRSVTLKVFERAADAGEVADTIIQTVRTVSNWTGSPNAIAPNRGIVETELSVGTDQNGINNGLTHSIRSAMLVDGWEAANDAEVEDGAKTMVPTQLLEPLGAALNAISVVPLLKEFEDMDDNFGCVNTSLLPTKELSGSISTTVGTPHAC